MRKLMELVEEYGCIRYRTACSGKSHDDLHDEAGAKMREIRAAVQELERDAARYRWLRKRMVGAHFNFDDEGMCVLAFEMPDTLAVCSDYDTNIDAAMEADK